MFMCSSVHSLLSTFCSHPVSICSMGNVNHEPKRSGRNQYIISVLQIHNHQFGKPLARCMWKKSEKKRKTRTNHLFAKPVSPRGIRVTPHQNLFPPPSKTPAAIVVVVVIISIHGAAHCGRPTRSPLSRPHVARCESSRDAAARSLSKSSSYAVSLAPGVSKGISSGSHLAPSCGTTPS